MPPKKPKELFKPKKRKGSGGLRVPSLKVLMQHHVELAVEVKNRIEIIEKLKPMRIKVYRADLDRLKLAGDGNAVTGFYRLLRVVSDLWVRDEEFMKLQRIGNGNARAGLLKVLAQYTEGE